MFIIKRKKIYDTNKLTMFRQYVEGNNNSLGKKINKLDNYLLKAVIYMLIHFTSNIILATLAVLLFHNFYLNTFVIMSAFIFASWKGSFKLMSLIVESETKNKINKTHSASSIQPTNTDPKNKQE
jgi:predicted membrane protein